MLNFSQKNPFSHFTVKQRKYPSYPTKYLHRMDLIKGRTLDFGCGLGVDVNYLKKLNYNVIGYDPFYFKQYPEGKFDTIICNYVLNVLLPEEQVMVLMEISELLKPEGKAYFAVRRDIKRNGFRYNPKYKCRTYQCQVTLPYKSILRTEHCEIYEYRHINQIEKAGANNCVFCNPDSERELITESASAYAIFDKFPVNKGHSLIVPKKHVENYFDLTIHEQVACLFVINRVKNIVAKRFHPDGFNIGVNIGDSAGQTIDHVHIHLIPRYKGDVNNPVGGIRNIIPGKGDYLSNLF